LRWKRRSQPHGLCPHDLEIGQGARERDRLFQRKTGIAATLCPCNLGMDDKGPRDGARVFPQFSASPS
jgi:hypothetical protein